MNAIDIFKPDGTPDLEEHLRCRWMSLPFSLPEASSLRSSSKAFQGVPTSLQAFLIDIFRQEFGSRFPALENTQIFLENSGEPTAIVTGVCKPVPGLAKQ